MPQIFTTFYFPGSGGDLWLQDSPRFRDDSDSEMDEIDETRQPSRGNFYGILDAWTQNSNYLKMSEKIGLEGFELRVFIDQEEDINAEL